MRTIFSMPMTRTKVRRPVVVAAMAAALTASVTGVAAASAPNPGFYTDHPLLGAGVVTSSAPDLRVGDCIMLGNGSARLTITAPVGGVADISWTGTAETTQTHSADIWHDTFTFKDFNGNTLGQSQRLDGPPMSVIGKFYSWTVPGQVNISSSNFAAIRQVTWKSEC